MNVVGDASEIHGMLSEMAVRFEVSIEFFYRGISLREKEKMLERKGKVIILIALSLIVLLLLLGFLASIIMVNENFSVKNVDDNTKLSIALEIGRLAKLPANISEFKIDGTRNSFSSTFLLKFKASSEDINQFIENSPSLKNITPEILTENHTYPPNTEKNMTNSKDDRYPWFNPVIEVKGRKYDIIWDEHNNYGRVIVDDLNNIVYVYISHS